MQLTPIDEDWLRNACVRSSLVLIASELDRLLYTPDLRRWCSQATVNLIQNCMRERESLIVTRTVVVFARRAALLASAMAWGESSVDA